MGIEGMDGCAGAELIGIDNPETEPGAAPIGIDIVPCVGGSGDGPDKIAGGGVAVSAIACS